MAREFVAKALIAPHPPQTSRFDNFALNSEGRVGGHDGSASPSTGGTVFTKGPGGSFLLRSDRSYLKLLARSIRGIAGRGKTGGSADW